MIPPLLIILAVIGSSSHAAAWDDLGHMMVSAIAYEQLTPETRQKVTTLLKLNPNHATWVADVPEDEKPRIAFLRASRWADDIKLDPAYEQDGSQNGNRPSGENPPGTSGMRIDSNISIGTSSISRSLPIALLLSSPQVQTHKRKLRCSATP
jgi:hypothetical protein